MKMHHPSPSNIGNRDAPSVAKCLQMAAEAIEGEKVFQFESRELSLLRQKLGLSRVSSSVSSTDNSSLLRTNSQKRKHRPGVRQPITRCDWRDIIAFLN